MRAQHVHMRVLAILLGGVMAAACATGSPEGFDARRLPAQTVSGEVAAVDAAARQLQVRGGDGETFTVAYTDETYVFYRGERSKVAALEPGDVVVVHLQSDEEGEVVADWVDVQRSLQERQRTLAPDQVEGEVVQVRTDERVLLLSTDQGARRLTFTDETTVVYQDETHPVTALDPGDIVLVTTAEADGELRRAERIEVVRSVQERSGGIAPSEREPVTVTGRVDSLDVRTRELRLVTAEGPVVVRIPYDLDAYTRRSLEMLRRGQTVRLVVVPLGANVVQLVSFD